jgi:murein DD-endopeptidase MepM/ murein hydrolase activator NlpD
MALENYYYYDNERCDFIPIRYGPIERVVYTACLWILTGVVVAGLGIITLSSFAGTPSEIALKAENNELISQLRETRQRINHLDSKVQDLAKVDNEMYRTVLGMDPIPYDERKAGVGGADIYSNYDNYSEQASDILKWTANNLDNLQRRINIQKVSFEEIKKYYNENQSKLTHLPAIKPTKGVILSGFGMRLHPVLGYRLMHDGLDFRARPGTEIYATGDGVIKHASRKSTYGNLVIIDHGFGFETRYAHLSAFAKGIRVGTKVKRGDLIAYSGNTGRTKGPHLHYEVHKSNRPVDPLNYLFAEITPEEYITYKAIAENNPNSMD